MDLPGMRPRPINWPDKLIMATMEVISKHRSKQTQYPLKYEANDFLGPVVQTSSGPVTFEEGGNTYTVDLDSPTYLSDLQIDIVNNGADIELVFKELHEAIKTMPSEITVSEGLSLVSALEDAISLSISKYGYEPTDEDIKMATAIIITTMKKLKVKSGYTKVETLAEKMMDATLRHERNEGVKARNKVGRAIKQMKSHPSKLDRLLALLALRKALRGL